MTGQELLRTIKKGTRLSIPENCSDMEDHETEVEVRATIDGDWIAYTHGGRHGMKVLHADELAKKINELERQRERGRQEAKEKAARKRKEAREARAKAKAEAQAKADEEAKERRRRKGTTSF